MVGVTRRLRGILFFLAHLAFFSRRNINWPLISAFKQFWPLPSFFAFPQLAVAIQLKPVDPTWVYSDFSRRSPLVSFSGELRATAWQKWLPWTPWLPLQKIFSLSWVGRLGLTSNRPRDGLSSLPFNPIFKCKKQSGLFNAWKYILLDFRQKASL